MLVRTRLLSRPSATSVSVYRAAALGRAVGTQVTQVASRDTRGPNSWAAGAPVSPTRPSAWAACWRAAALRRCLQFSSAPHSQVSRWRGRVGGGPVADRGLSHSRAVLFTRSRCLLKVSLLTEPGQHAEWNGLSFPVFVDADLLRATVSLDMLSAKHVSSGLGRGPVGVLGGFWDVGGCFHCLLEGRG